MNNEKKFIKLTPFKMQVLQSFPFIDADFDAITNYELLCKVVEYLNKTVDNVDLLNEKVEEFQKYFDNLDVQDEINNKLDEMAESGELEAIIKEYVDPIYQDFENEINNQVNNQNNEISSFKSNINTEIATINNKVNNIVSGSPKGVYGTLNDLISADPSHDYIYVVSANGNWYYYDNTQNNWVSGGVYQSTVIDPDSPNLINMFRGFKYVTDNTLDSSTNNLNNITNLRCYLYYVTKTNITNIPDVEGPISSFIIYGLSFNSTNSNSVQCLYDLKTSKNYTRVRFGSGNFGNWKENVNEIDKIIKFTDFIYSTNVNDNNKDFNNMTCNTMKSFYLRQDQMLNSPNFGDTNTHYINVMNFGYSNNYFTQLAIETLPHQSVHYRNKNNGTWTSWNTVPSNINDIINYVNYSYLTSIIQEPLDLHNKDLTFCGDSITAGNFVGPNNAWAKFLSDKLNTSYNNKATGGATFALVPNATQIIDQLTTGVNNPILFIAGGINDYAKSVSKVDFTNAINNICSWLNENYTGKVIFITPINHAWTTITNEIPLNWYREEITRIALSNGYSVIAGTELGFPTLTGDMASLLYYDGLHPSVIGQQMYANKVYEIIK